MEPKKINQFTKEHEEFLHHITNDLIDAASKGKCYFEFIMTAKVSTDDRWHFKQWLEVIEEVAMEKMT